MNFQHDGRPGHLDKNIVTSKLFSLLLCWYKIVVVTPLQKAGKSYSMMMITALLEKQCVSFEDEMVAPQSPVERQNLDEAGEIDF